MKCPNSWDDDENGQREDCDDPLHVRRTIAQRRREGRSKLIGLGRARRLRLARRARTRALSHKGAQVPMTSARVD